MHAAHITSPDFTTTPHTAHAAIAFFLSFCLFVLFLSFGFLMSKCM
jgi:hypothetical protein